MTPVIVHGGGQGSGDDSGRSSSKCQFKATLLAGDVIGILSRNLQWQASAWGKEPFFL